MKLIRASSKPYSGAYSYFNKNKIHIWKAHKSLVIIYGVAGKIFIVNKEIHICCGSGSINIIDNTHANILNKR